MGPRDRFYPYLYHCDYIGLLGTGFMQVFHLGRAPRTKEVLPDFLKWRRVTRHPLVFRGLTGSQRTPGFGASHSLCNSFPSPSRFGPFLLKKMTTIPYFVLFLIKLSKNAIHVPKILNFDTWLYFGHPFPSSLYSYNMCHMCTCYR